MLLHPAEVSHSVVGTLARILLEIPLGKFLHLFRGQNECDLRELRFVQLLALQSRFSPASASSVIP